jgi:hypothetical protein
MPGAFDAADRTTYRRSLTDGTNYLDRAVIAAL